MDLLYIVELKETLIKYNILKEYSEKIINEIQEGFPDNGLDEIEIYDYISKILVHYTCKDPIFNTISSEYQIKIYDKTIGKDYFKLISEQ